MKNISVHNPRKKNSILFQFAVIFTIFVLVILIICGFFTYIYQEAEYQKLQEEKLHKIADYLSLVIQINGSDFATYQKYFLENYDKILVPANFTKNDVAESKRKFSKLFSKNYPGKVLGCDITFNELSSELKLAYAVYRHEYYLSMFEEANRIFDLIYVYYLVPDTENLRACYLLDATRETFKKDDKEYISLGIYVPQKRSEHMSMWEAWETESYTPPNTYDVFDNKYGNTYAWHYPLYINGEKLGLICTEVNVKLYNREIAMNTLKQLVIIAVILIIAVIITLYIVNKLYISRIKNLAYDISRYSSSKDAKLAGIIEKTTAGTDEISELGNQTAAMIMELENYMESLVNITKQLSETKEQVSVISKLANKDALTGIKNRNAYEEEVKHLEWKIADGKTDFGIAMVDLNYLKRINDTYGHEHGNVALKKCCDILCDIFSKSSVFRIGGDEFVIILENDDYKNINQKVEKFNNILNKQKNDSSLKIWEQISAAIGFALFEPKQDEGVSNVFKRADKAMYARKNAMKANRK